LIDTNAVAFVDLTLNNCIAAHGDVDGYTTNETGDAERPYNGYKITYNNCFAYDFGRYGFTSKDPIGIDGDRTYANNVSYYNRGAGGINSFGGCCQTFITNSWENGLTVTEADFISLDWTQLYRPRQSDGSLPIITFGTLAETSDLIDAGTDVGLAYEGSAPDIGWSEYESPISAEEPNVIISKPYPIILRSATVAGNCNDDGGGTVSARGLCWATHTNPDLTDNVITSGSGTGAFSINITGLLPNTTYYVRIYATNEAGTNYSEQYTFTTLIHQTINSGAVVVFSSDGKTITIN
jgi:hypothetical protein